MALVVAGVLAAVVLGGCTDDASPVVTPSPTASSANPSPSPSPSASVSPSATASGPAIPAAARAQTPAGAEAFVRFFFDELNLAWTRPDPSVLPTLSRGECQFCKKMQARAVELSESGQRYASDPVEVKTLTVLEGAPAGDIYFDLGLLQNAVNVIDKAGKVITSDSQKQGHFNVGVRWSAGEWKFLDMESKP
ncbi:DUF6318 family protein [Nostocoides sp. Soil756]|uniref:DUF6318 family protein n=1 Tax=Nostocoides sp. Soil756 TaxID=1736399 RepID=UPI0012FB035A|nr:DUF6318 family protein [Tetrasphaera sp. Soil756]